MEEVHPRKILIVEDDPGLVGLLEQVLEEDGFEVHAETRGFKALEYAAEHPLDLVVLDVGLPDLDGFQVCKQLRKICNPWTIPILMLTGRREPIDRLRGFAHGADAYLVKPHSTEELLKTIGLLLGDVTTT